MKNLIIRQKVDINSVHTSHLGVIPDLLHVLVVGLTKTNQNKSVDACERPQISIIY